MTNGNHKRRPVKDQGKNEGTPKPTVKVTKPRTKSK